MVELVHVLVLVGAAGLVGLLVDEDTVSMDASSAVEAVVDDAPLVDDVLDAPIEGGAVGNGVGDGHGRERRLGDHCKGPAGLARLSSCRIDSPSTTTSAPRRSSRPRAPIEAPETPVVARWMAVGPGPPAAARRSLGGRRSGRGRTANTAANRRAMGDVRRAWDPSHRRTRPRLGATTGVRGCRRRAVWPDEAAGCQAPRWESVVSTPRCLAGRAAGCQAPR